MTKQLSWEPINWDRWDALAWVIDEVDSGAANNLTGTLPKLTTSWERLRQDYESALLFLDTALDATARGLGASGAVPVRRWTDLVNVAEAGDSLSTETNRDILYLQRTVLFSRNKGIAHPNDELVEVTTTALATSPSGVFEKRQTGRALASSTLSYTELAQTSGSTHMWDSISRRS